MKLKLDLEGTMFTLSLPETASTEWYSIEFSLNGKYIHYSRDAGICDKTDLQNLCKALSNEGRMTPDEAESFGAEIWFNLFPTWQVPKRGWNGEMIVCFVNEDDELGFEELTGTEIKFELNGADIFALKVYLQYILAEVDESDDCVKDLMQQGMLV